MTQIGHGGKTISERVITDVAQVKKRIGGLLQLPISGRAARESIDIAYGFFSPLKGFMGKADVESVCENMTTQDGTLWPIPIVLDVESSVVKDAGLKSGQSIVLTFQHVPLAIMDISEIYSLDKMQLQQSVFGTTDAKHPGVIMYNKLNDTFLAGEITLINSPVFQPPYGQFWYTPLTMREKMAEKGWKRSVAHQTRNVPHSGHEWLMKGAWFSTHGEMPVEKLESGIVVSAIIGPKRAGDYIDEAILIGQQTLQDAGYFRPATHLVSFVMWDMRYAGPREAILHAIIRENLGCTHHMFGRDHAGVGTYYGPYDAHRIFDGLPENSLRIKPVRVLEWWYCPVCGEVTYSGLCGHDDKKQPFSGTLIRSIIQDKVKPTRLIFRPEVFDSLMRCADEYGFGSPFCNETYLEKRQPVFTLSTLD
ncbi:sulfate adenylyltransferase [candidate division KSB1 bacterium]|nr:sulfate adenylyltransferase [candidate division KSB1 bacterium]